MFIQCLQFFGNCIMQIMQLTIPGTNLTFLQLAIGLAFLPVLINVFARIFGGTIGVDTAIETARKIEEKHNESSEEE